MKRKTTRQLILFLISGLLLSTALIGDLRGDDQDQVQVKEQLQLQDGSCLEADPDQTTDSVVSAVVAEPDTAEEALLAALPLNELEKESILHMREEEKLARDVYMMMAELWGANIFSNIVASEQIHMDVVKLLIDKYNLEDPVDEEETPGVFTEESGFADLYSALLELGSISPEAALEAGVIIEEQDIEDLTMYLESEDPSITHRSIRRVYQHLLDASKQHLLAFETHLSAFETD